MRSSTMLVGAMAQAVFGAIEPKNFIFIIPDGLAPASQTLIRTYLSMSNSSTPDAPSIDALPVDVTTIGNTRTHSFDNLVTDSAAAGTALAAGVKTENGALGVLPDGQPVGTVLEAAKLNGYLTALVVTSTINHATPAAFSAHVGDRDATAAIAEQQIGYSHPLNQSVDLMLGGGRCFFRPESHPDSCREDDIDLFAFAEEKGYFVAQDREGFEELEGGLGEITLPYIGLFNDNNLEYEIDRMQQPEEEREPSLSAMTKTALNSLERASRSQEKGYFMMIEASRVDHAMHDNDAAAHLWDVIEYNRAMDVVMKWIDKHPDTAMISVADHETGGLTLPPDHDPRPLQASKHSAAHLAELWEEYNGTDRRSYLEDSILAPYGISDATDDELEDLLEEDDDFTQSLVDILNNRTNIEWSTNGHSAVDVTLYGYAAGKMGDQLRHDLAGSWDNTDMPKYIAKSLGVDMDEVTQLLRANGTDWIPTTE